MAAATADRDGKRSEGEVKSYAVAATTKIYKDTLVGVNAAGHLVPLAHGTSGLIFVGVAIEQVDNTGAAAAKSCRVRRKGEYEFIYNGADATIANVGDEVFALDDQTVDEDATTVTNEYRVGQVVGFESTTKLRISIDRFTGSKAAAAAIVSLTDNSGGAANDTVEDVPAAYNEAALANNFADLAGKINAILTALRAAGIIAQ